MVPGSTDEPMPTEMMWPFLSTNVSNGNNGFRNLKNSRPVLPYRYIRLVDRGQDENDVAETTAETERR